MTMHTMPTTRPAQMVGNFLRGELPHDEGGGVRWIHVTHVASLEAMIDSTVRFFCSSLDDARPYIAARMPSPSQAERELFELLKLLSGAAEPTAPALQDDKE